MSNTGASGARRPRRSQEERSAETRQRIVDATIASLIDAGYARTTTVEVCKRAGVTRGALNHHFSGMGALLVAVVEQLYVETGKSVRASTDGSLSSLVRQGWERLRRREYKAVIEVWLACRNDRELRRELDPAIRRLRSLFDPSTNRSLGSLLGADPDRVTFYRLMTETLIGMALRRATTAARSIAHEEEIVALLAEFARQVESRGAAE